MSDASSLPAGRQVCGACGVEIKTCETCGGKMCVDGCADRAEDGCTCKKED